MTPAILPGYHAHTLSHTNEPYVVNSDDPQDCVRGVLVFGLGRTSRSRLKSFYQKLHLVLQLNVIADVRSGSPRQDCVQPGDRGGLERRTFAADVFLWQSAAIVDGHAYLRQQEWTLESYLSNSLFKARGETMLVGPQEGPCKKVVIPETDNLVQNPPRAQRKVVHASSGHLDYEVADNFTESDQDVSILLSLLSDLACVGYVGTMDHDQAGYLCLLCLQAVGCSLHGF
nr:hypothetical protein CFP56_68773 [Quercus suber]